MYKTVPYLPGMTSGLTRKLKQKSKLLEKVTIDTGTVRKLNKTGTSSLEIATNLGKSSGGLA
jgi:hypothetical protein